MGTDVALCYIRISLARGEELSPDRQREMLLRECEYHGYEPEWYEDTEGYRSGRLRKTRPAWLELEQQTDRDDVAAVIVERIDRAGRNRIDLLQFAEDCLDHDVTFISVRERIDFGTPHGQHIFAILASSAQYESDMYSERMKTTISYKRHEKAEHFGAVPFGCDRVEGKLVPTTAGVWWHPDTDD